MRGPAAVRRSFAGRSQGAADLTARRISRTIPGWNRALIVRCLPMRGVNELLINNQAWAAKMTSEDPGFFQQLAAQQAPDYLWIGCSDSRVPANQLTGLLPGEM